MLGKSIYKSRISIIFVCLLFGFVFASCGGGSDWIKTIPGGNSDGGGISLPSTISGTVSKDLVEKGVKGNDYITKAPGACAGSSFDEYVIGGWVDDTGTEQYTVVYSGTADSSGNFEAKAPKTDEVVIEFDCGMRCFGQPDTINLVCDPASNAIVEALEEALEENVKDSFLYKGLSIAKIAAGLIEILKAEKAMCDQLPDSPSCTSVTLDNLINPPSGSTPYEIIQASSTLSGLFNNLRTLALEVKAFNETGDADAAAELSWSVENIISMLTGLGISVNVTVDDGTGNGPGGLYSDMMTNIDSWVFPDSSKGLITNLKPYLINLYNKIFVTQETSQVTMYCYARQRSNNGPELQLKYQPRKYDTPEHEKRLTCLKHIWYDENEVDKGTGALGITTADGVLKGDWDVALMIAPSFTEPDRNDVTGEHVNENKQDNFRVEVINAYPEFMDGMQDPTKCGNHVIVQVSFTAAAASDILTLSGKQRPYYIDQEVTVSTDGTLPDPLSAVAKYYIIQVVDATHVKISLTKRGASITMTDAGTGAHSLVMGEKDMYFENDPVEVDGDRTFAECIKDPDFNPATDDDLSKYFSGLLGIYKFMRNPELRGGRFSLENLYDAFAGVDYMGIRIDADMWQFGLNNNSSVIEWGGDYTYHIPPYLLKDYDTFFQVVCPENGLNGTYPFDLCQGNPATPRPSSDLTPIDITGLSNPAGAIGEFVQQFAPTYESTMADFEYIPTMEQIKESIFGDAHHEPYNIKGSATFYVRGVRGLVYQQDSPAPILCTIDNPNAAGDFVSGRSTIICKAAREAGDVWIDGMPNAKTAEKYKKYYALVDRGGGFNEDGSNKFYGLLNFRNGMDYSLNGREFRVRGILTVGGSGISDTTVQSISRDVCNTWTDSSGNPQTNCWKEMFDFVSVPFKSTWFPENNYYPYTWNMSFPNSYGGGTYNTSVAIHNNMTAANIDSGDDVAVCIPGTDVTVDVANNNTQRVTAAIFPAANLINCSSGSGTYYYLQPNWGDITDAADRDNLRYRLIRNDGKDMWSDVIVDSDSETFTVDPTGLLVASGAAARYKVDDQVRIETTGTLPSPLWDGGNYTVSAVVDDTHIRLKNCWGCPEITVTPGGSGTHTISYNIRWANYVTKAELETAVTAPGNQLCKDADDLTINCSGTDLFGPATIYTNLPEYEIANLGHDPKYDPYCDDTKAPFGVCNCLNPPGGDMSQCSLENEADPDEETLSTLPYCDTCTDPGTQKIAYLLKTHGGKSGDTLADDLAADPVDITTANADWKKLFECENGQDLNYVNISDLRDGIANAGGGCGHLAFTTNIGSPNPNYLIFSENHNMGWGQEVTLMREGTLPAPLDDVDEDGNPIVYYVRSINNTTIELSLTQNGTAIVLTSDGIGDNYVLGGMGTVRMKKIVKRNNAYNVARPNALMRLITAATATTGTGIRIQPDRKIFSFQEALSLMFLRLNMPTGGTVMGPGAEGEGEILRGASVYFRQTELPNNHNDPVSGLMRAFLEQAGYIEPYNP